MDLSYILIIHIIWTYHIIESLIPSELSQKNDISYEYIKKHENNKCLKVIELVSSRKLTTARGHGVGRIGVGVRHSRTAVEES